VCISGSCGPCTGDAQCGLGQTCTFGTCSSSGFCPLGTYDLDPDAGSGCQTTCNATQCTGADGGVLSLGALPLFMVGHQYASFGVLVGGANASKPMTGTSFSEGGATSDPGSTPVLLGAHYQLQGGLAH
jgi:hypothetical protein